MTAKELDSLKSLPVPPPRDEAKAAAVSAALDAFDKSAGAAQASTAIVRPISPSTNSSRRSLMTLTRQQYALAASLAALVVAAPVAFHVSRTVEQDPVELSGNATPAPQVATKDELSKEKSDADKRRASSDLLTRLDAERKRAAEAEVDIAGERAPEPAASTVVASPPPPPVAAKPLAAPGLVARDATRRMDAWSSLGAIGAADSQAPYLPAQLEESRDRFMSAGVNPVKQVATDPVSTFSIDVDTASYAFVRRALNAGRLPPQSAVRAEEMINYFRYDYPAAETPAEPFKPTVTVVPSPWGADKQLVHIGIKGYELKSAERPRANLVFLIDVSGSMAPADRLPLVKNGLRMLVEDMQPDDTVAIVTYASGSGVALEPTRIADKAKILAALDGLGAGGSTAGASGIEDAYRLAAANFEKTAVNRIILATDGDFNVGLTDDSQLKDLIERKRAGGIFLSILGVGAGNYNDRLMQELAQNGNGVAAYADTLNEARKVLVEEAASTLFPIAKDVKIQVEWNPARVGEYRLIGYESRALNREDFNNDKVDAGDIGSGHTVTAIYEITPAGAAVTSVDALRYGDPAKPAATASPASSELGFLKIRYKLPASETSTPISLPITDALALPSLDAAPADTRFSIAVAGFAEVLRGSPHTGSFGYDDVVNLATPARGADPYGERSEFLNLVRLAKSAPR